MNSPSSSSALTLDYYNITCKICGKDGHGLHFGVQSCRACAAFFRRTVILEKKYRCRYRNGQCDVIQSNDKLFCRFCRLKKCLDSGMTTENVRIDQLDVPSKNEISPIKNETSNEGPPPRIEYNVVNIMTKKPAIMVDVAAIIRKSQNILEKHFLQFDDDFIHLNSLQKATESLKRIRSGQNSNPVFLKQIDFIKIISMWEENMMMTAEWLMYCDGFRSLPIHERMAIFKIVWAVWRRVERYTMGAEIFGQRCYDEKIVLHSHNEASRGDEYCVDYSHVSDTPDEAISKIFGPKSVHFFDIIVKPVLELKPSLTEITYILSQIVWSYASRRLQGQTMATADKFLETIGNNLHEYYKDAAYENYANRIIKMMNIVNLMLNSQLKRENTMDMALLFDLFNIVMTDPDFFRV